MLLRGYASFKYCNHLKTVNTIKCADVNNKIVTFLLMQ